MTKSNIIAQFRASVVFGMRINVKKIYENKKPARTFNVLAGSCSDFSFIDELTS
jgi:hypothetical protein